MTSLTKNPQPQAKNFFRVQTRRLAVSFDTSTRSVTHTGAEKFPCKATCVSAFFIQKSPKQPDAKVLSYHQTVRAAKTSVNTTGVHLYTTPARGSLKYCEFRLRWSVHASWLILSVVYKTAPAASIAVSYCWLASLCFLAQVVWMREEYNSVLTTPTEANEFNHFGQYQYIGKTQISARPIWPIYQSISTFQYWDRHVEPSQTWGSIPNN